MTLIANLQAQIEEIRRQLEELRAGVPYRTPKLPSFFQKDPAVWFQQVEASFRLARITSQVTMADMVIAGLDSNVALVISDLIATPDPTNPYDRLKERIIRTFSSSGESKLRQLLREQLVTDEKPSQLLARLRNLSGESCSDAVLKTVFVEHLPQQCRGILAASKLESLQRLAELADAVVEALNPGSGTIAAASRDTACARPTADGSSVDEHIQCQLDKIEHEIANSLSCIQAIRFPTEFDVSELSAEQDKCQELKKLLESPEPSLTLKRLTWGPTHSPIYCNTSQKSLKPYIPRSMRERVFELFHDSSHPQVNETRSLICERYVWPDMHSDIDRWCKSCVYCQQAKVTLYLTTLSNKFYSPDKRFSHVYIDIVGPLPSSEGFQHLLMMVDPFSRWPEAVPIGDTSAQTVARVFFDTWVARFGAPTCVTSDQGLQFESQEFSALLSFIGCQHIRTTAYDPAANGLVERWHHDLRAALIRHSRQCRQWSLVLSTVLLGLRTRVRLDTLASPTDFMYGKKLCVPGEFFVQSDCDPNPCCFLEEFRGYIREVRPVPVEHYDKRKTFFYQDLASCTHVFLCKGGKRPLVQAYAGPYKVLERRADSCIAFEDNGTTSSTYRRFLKPAYFIPEQGFGVEVGVVESESESEKNISTPTPTLAL